MYSDLDLSPLRLAILCLILQEPRSGYQLKKSFEQTPMGHFSSSPGAIYPALKRMEEDGWVVGTPEDPASPRSARILSLTDDGLTLLSDYFRRPVDEQDVIHGMDRLMLRFAFMTPLVGRKATRGFLEELIEALSKHVVTLREASLEIENDPLEGRLALQRGVLLYESTLGWAQHALDALSREASQSEQP